MEGIRRFKNFWLVLISFIDENLSKGFGHDEAVILQDINHTFICSKAIFRTFNNSQAIKKAFSSWWASVGLPKSVLPPSPLLPFNRRLSKLFSSICFLIDEMYRRCLSECHKNFVNIGWEELETDAMDFNSERSVYDLTTECTALLCMIKYVATDPLLRQRCCNKSMQ